MADLLLLGGPCLAAKLMKLCSGRGFQLYGLVKSEGGCVSPDFQIRDLETALPTAASTPLQILFIL